MINRVFFPKGNEHIEQDDGICPYFPVGYEPELK